MSDPVPLPRLYTKRKSGAEPLHADLVPVGGSVHDFWEWSASDLVSNAMRGRLAEYLVHLAVGGAHDAVRDEWDAYDLITPDGIKVEVKSSAYLQTWGQKVPSVISFGTPATRAWSATDNSMETDQRRQADVYVFALLHHRDKATIDPLNVRQWSFYVVGTHTLEARIGAQRSVGLELLKKMCASPVPFEGLAPAIRQASLVDNAPAVQR